MSAPELTCECCAAGGCPHAARRALGDLRARHGHAIQVVNVVGAMMNFLVARVRSGHPVGHGHTISSHGLLFAAEQLQGAELAQALAHKCTACSCHSQVVRLEPMP